MLQYQAPRESPVPAGRQAVLLREFRDLLRDRGMASIDEFGDMLDWPLPRRDGMSRHFHVFHPDMCTWSDAFRGTVHFHGGAIRGTVLLGGVEHWTYAATADPNGDRILADQAYRLSRHETAHAAGTQYWLAADVAHWIRPQRLTLTYFEEEDNDRLGDLVDPIGAGHDDHVWEQPDADALVARLLTEIEDRLTQLESSAQETIVAVGTG